jgi:hypothetical protein
MNVLSQLCSGTEDETRSNWQENLDSLDVAFSRYRRILYRVAYRVLENHQEAKDAVRNCLLAVICDIICRRYFVIICRKLFPCGSWRRGQRKPMNVRYRAVSCSSHTLNVGGAAYGRDGSEVCFRTSQRLIVHPRTDATNSGKRSTTNNVTSYTPGNTVI